MEHGDSASMQEQLQMVMTIKTEVDAAATSLTHVDIEIDLNHIIQEPVQSVKSEPSLLMNEKVLEDSSQSGNEQQSAQGASASAGTHKLSEVCGNSLDYFRNIKQEPGDMDIGPIVVQHMDIHYAINKNPSAITEDNTIVDDCNEAMPGSGVKKESREDKMRGSLTPLKALMKEWNAYRMLPNLQRTVHKERLQSICRVNLIRRDAFQCKFCGAAYAEHRWLLRHLQSVHGCHQQTHLFVKFCKTNKQQCAAGNKTIPCKYCCQTMTKVDYELKSCLGQQKDLQQRLMQQHRVMSSNNFKCDTCGRTFHEPHLLSAHKELHQQNNNKISLATKSVVAGPSNQAHIGEKLYNCDKCDAKFALSSQLTSHVKVHTGAKPYSCDMCDARFGRSSHLTSHVKVHTGEKPYQCNICNVRLTRKGDLNVHMRIHTGEKPYHCDICDARFVYSGHLKTHMRIHTGEKPYQCGICGKKFAHSGSLTSHMRVHTGEKPYECGMCDKRFTKSSNLTSHVKVHTGEKPYPCDLCDARFAHSSGLTAHLRGHTGEKPYSCDTCDARFARSTTLTNHMIVHTGEKPYQCDICDAQYARKYSLILHLRAHTRTGKSELK